MNHRVVSVANVRTKSHWSPLAVELFRLDVELLVDGDEMCPLTGRQYDVLGRCDRRGYAHLTRLDNEHPIMQVAKSERTVLQWRCTLVITAATVRSRYDTFCFHLSRRRCR